MDGNPHSVIGGEGSFVQRVAEDEVVVVLFHEDGEVGFFAETEVLRLCDGANLAEPGRAGDEGIGVARLEKRAEGVGGDLLVEDQDVFRCFREVEMLEGLLCKGIGDVVRRTEGGLQPLGSAEAAWRDDEVAFILRGIDVMCRI